MQPTPLERTAARVRELAEIYEPPTFAHVTDPNAAIFLCAIDHRTGYRSRYLVGGRGPFEGSALLWAVGLQAAERERGFLTAASLREVNAARVADAFRIGGETVADPDRRAALWRDLAAGLERDHEGEASELLRSADGMLEGSQGLIGRLAPYEAYSDPLRKKSFLFAKICERRGWFRVRDTERWQVSADNVLMRLALRAGLVRQGSLAEVRAATREACAELARESGVAVPVLDDLLWELGRADPDLLGAEGGDITEPLRDPDSAWY